MQTRVAFLKWLPVILLTLIWLPGRPEARQSDRLLPAVVAQIDIRTETDPEGLDPEGHWPALARALLGFQEGERLSAERLDEALNDLAKLARVESEISQIEGGVRLTLRLAPYRRIKSIAIEDNYPLFDRDVANAMTVAPGDLFIPEAVARQAELIEARYRSEGYIDPRAKIAWAEDPEDGHYHLTVTIEKGVYYRHGAMRFAGNRAFSDERLRLRILGWRTLTGLFAGDRFIAKDFDEEVKELTAFYRAEGYADVSIVSDIARDPAAQQVDTRIEIREGPLYTISFAGNAFFPDRRLREDLALFEIGNRGNIGLRRSLHNIRRRYTRSGFADIAVRWEEASAQEDSRHRRITIRIDEGPRYIVEAVHIRGNTELDEAAIRGQMLTRPPRTLDDGAFAAAALEEDLQAIRSLYLSNGFLDARIGNEIQIDPLTQRVSLRVDIQEGVRTVVERIDIEEDTPLSIEQLQAVVPFSAGDPYRPYLMQSAVNALAAQISPLGYPHVQVSDAVTISEDGRKARIQFKIEKGPLVRVGPLFFAGNFKTRTAVLQRELGFESGQRFSLADVLAAQRNLRNLGLFDSVQVRTMGLKEKAPNVPMLIEVKEKDPYYFEIGAGYQTDKGPYLRSRVGDRNFRGKDQEVWSAGEASGIGYRWDVGISNPRLLGTRIKADLGTFSEQQELLNQEFGTRISGGSVLLSRALGARISSSLGWRYEYREQYLRNGDTDESDEALDPRSILVTTPSIRYDSRDSFVQPRRGLYTSLSVDISTGLQNSLDNFLRYRFDVRHFYSPFARLTLASLARAGYLSTYGGDSIVPQDQLFYLGGFADVRGFEENMLRFDADGDPVGGRLALNGSLEARYDLGRGFEMGTFVDAGSLRETQTGALGNDEFRWTAGLALRYITPIGPIGLIYGHKLNPQSDESPGRFHFTIGYTF